MATVSHSSSTWLALGDSYTIGEGVLPHERWPTQLAGHLNLSPPQYLAETGWTTVDLLAAIGQTRFERQYDWVSVLIGVNDQYDGLNIDTYRQGLTRIIDFAARQAIQQSHVLVVSIPDYSVAPAVSDKNPDHIVREIMCFNAVAQEIAVATSVTYCDITELSQRAANDPLLLVEDQLHPSGKMYALWAEKIVSELVG